jgi:hypothetical protein
MPSRNLGASHHVTISTLVDGAGNNHTSAASLEGVETSRIGSDSQYYDNEVLHFQSESRGSSTIVLFIRDA